MYKKQKKKRLPVSCIVFETVKPPMFNVLQLQIAISNNVINLIWLAYISDYR